MRYSENCKGGFNSKGKFQTTGTLPLAKPEAETVRFSRKRQQGL